MLGNTKVKLRGYRSFNGELMHVWQIILGKLMISLKVTDTYISIEQFVLFPRASLDTPDFNIGDENSYFTRGMCNSATELTNVLLVHSLVH